MSNKEDFDIFIFAGENSGDLHGQGLIKELKKIQPNIKIAAVAGPRMRSEGVFCYLQTEAFQVMGFVDVLLALPKIAVNFYKLARFLLRHRFKAALFIDYPGFCLRMERYLKRKGFAGALLHYIAPSVWAHGKGRIKAMEKSLSELFYILPFEGRYFENTSLTATYTGHPLIARIEETSYQTIDVLKNKEVVAMFPGSRKREIIDNLPLYLELVKHWQEKYPSLCYAISTMEHTQALVEEELCKHGLKDRQGIYLIPAARNYDLMKMAKLALAKCGTVTLELALHRVPTCVTYGARNIDIFIARNILGVNLPFYSLANLLLGEWVFPELIGPNFTKERLFEEAKNLLRPDAARRCQSLCDRIRWQLGTHKASRFLAEKVAKYLTATPRC